MVVVNLCECGCGELTKISDRDRPERGYMKGQPRRFVRGHARTPAGPTGPRIAKPDAPNPSGRCMCGCGETTAIAAYTSRRDGSAYGEHQRFIHGHNTRTGLWQRQTGRDAGRWYIYDRNRKTVAWARIVLEDRLGRPLRHDEQAHHVNEDKSDDRPENLLVLSLAEHARTHALRRRARHSVS
jgi:hypothetical protein